MISSLRYLPIVCGMFPIPLATQAQHQRYIVSGLVCDSTSRVPQAYATVRLLQGGAKGNAVRVSTTDVEGRFAIQAPAIGRYVLEVVMMGLQPAYRSVSLTEAVPSVPLDTIRVREYSTTLGGATVTAVRPVVTAEVDKVTYSMADDPDAQNSTVLEMLRKVPMVTVDGDDNIKVNGSSGFKVYVNGKPNQMLSQNPSEILKSYPASAIKKIEVITNPGAKYDAEGVAGVLNIITDTETKATGYMITPEVGYANDGVRGGAFAMVQKGKFTMSLNYNVGHMDRPRDTRHNEREIYGAAANHYYRQDGSNKITGQFQFGNVDASYEFSSKDLLSVSAGVFGWNAKATFDAQDRMSAADGTLTYSNRQVIKFDNRNLGINASTDYQHTFSEDNHLTLSYRLDLSPTRDKRDVVYTDIYNYPVDGGLQDREADPRNHSEEHTGQIDYTARLNEIHTLSAGLKYIYRLNRSDNSVWTRPSETDAPFAYDDKNSIRYRHRGDIGAAYLEYTLKRGKWSFVAGNRYEYYRMKVSYPDGKREAFAPTMNNWVPSVTLGYALQPTMMLKAGYNLRISRPDISALSPYVAQDTPEAISYGNPNLESSKTHNINATFSSFTPKVTFNASLTYSFSHDGLTQYAFIQDGIRHETYAQFLRSDVASLDTYLNWNVTTSTQVNLHAAGSYSNYRANETGDRHKGYAGNAFVSVRQNLPWKLQLSAFGGGGVGDITLQGRGSNYRFYSLSLKRSFLKADRMTVSLQAGGFIGRYLTFTNEERTEQFYQKSSQRMDCLRLGISLRYRIGELKATVKKAGRTIENDDVQSTAKGTQSGVPSESGE